MSCSSASSPALVGAPAPELVSSLLPPGPVGVVTSSLAAQAQPRSEFSLSAFPLVRKEKVLRTMLTEFLEENSAAGWYRAAVQHFGDVSRYMAYLVSTWHQCTRSSPAARSVAAYSSFVSAKQLAVTVLPADSFTAELGGPYTLAGCSDELSDQIFISVFSNSKSKLSLVSLKQLPSHPHLFHLTPPENGDWASKEFLTSGKKIKNTLDGLQWLNSEELGPGIFVIKAVNGDVLSPTEVLSWYVRASASSDEEESDSGEDLVSSRGDVKVFKNSADILLTSNKERLDFNLKQQHVQSKLLALSKGFDVDGTQLLGCQAQPPSPEVSGLNPNSIQIQEQQVRRPTPILPTSVQPSFQQPKQSWQPSFDSPVPSKPDIQGMIVEVTGCEAQGLKKLFVRVGEGRFVSVGGVSKILNKQRNRAEKKTDSELLVELALKNRSEDQKDKDQISITAKSWDHWIVAAQVLACMHGSVGSMHAAELQVFNMQCMMWGNGTSNQNFTTTSIERYHSLVLQKAVEHGIPIRLVINGDMMMFFNTLVKTSDASTAFAWQTSIVISWWSMSAQSLPQ